MKTLVFGEPSGKQKLFLCAKEKYIGYGGARGGGKSWAVRTKAVLLAMRYPGIKIMIVRRTYPELQENHIIPLCELLSCYGDRSSRIASYNDGKKHIMFPNGSRILFRYCDADRDAQRFQGTEVDVLFIDEATQQSEEKYKKLTACVRGVNEFPKRVYLTANPGGEGHAWFKRLFIDRQFRKGENAEDYTFIQALPKDNAALMRQNPDYIGQLEALPPKLRDAWLYGRWDVYEGQFFEEFVNDPEHYTDRLYTHVIAPFEIPDAWRIYRSFDWGYGKPFSCAWWAVDYDGVLYRILELYGCKQSRGEPIANEGVKWNPDEVFKEIHRIETEHRFLSGKKISGVADPAIWDAETGESIAETASKYRVYFEPGDHKRIPGWMQMHYRLRFDEHGRPMMYIFSNCKAFIRTVPTLIYDEHKPEDLDTKGEDHVADETRYMCMARPIRPAVQAQEDKYAKSPLRMFLDIEKSELVAAPRGEGKIEIVTKESDKGKI